MLREACRASRSAAVSRTRMHTYMRVAAHVWPPSWMFARAHTPWRRVRRTRCDGNGSQPGASLAGRMVRTRGADAHADGGDGAATRTERVRRRAQARHETVLPGEWTAPRAASSRRPLAALPPAALCARDRRALLRSSLACVRVFLSSVCCGGEHTGPHAGSGSTLYAIESWLLSGIWESGAEDDVYMNVYLPRPSTPSHLTRECRDKTDRH